MQHDKGHQILICNHIKVLSGRRLIVGAYEVTEAGEALLGTACSEPFTVVRNNDNTEGASYSPIQIPVKRSWGGWAQGSVQVRCNLIICHCYLHCT